MPPHSHEKRKYINFVKINTAPSDQEPNPKESSENMSNLAIKLDNEIFKLKPGSYKLSNNSDRHWTNVTNWQNQFGIFMQNYSSQIKSYVLLENNEIF